MTEISERDYLLIRDQALRMFSNCEVDLPVVKGASRVGKTMILMSELLERIVYGSKEDRYWGSL